MAEEKKEKPSLEELAGDLAQMEEKHMLEHIIPSMLDTWVTHPGVKYTDKNGHVKYKTKLSEEQRLSLADALFDALAYHANLRMYPNMTPEMFEQEKKIKDTLGNYKTDRLVYTEFGIDRHSLRQQFAKRKTITEDFIKKFAQQMYDKQHEEIEGKILSKVRANYKVEHLKDFINKNVKEHKSNPGDYPIGDLEEYKEIVPYFNAIAQQHYRKEEDKK